MNSSSLSKHQVIFCQGEEQLISLKSEQDLTLKRKKEPFQHPRVYLTFGDKAETACPYCSRIFRKNSSELI